MSDNVDTMAEEYGLFEACEAINNTIYDDQIPPTLLMTAQDIARFLVLPDEPAPIKEFDYKVISQHPYSKEAIYEAAQDARGLNHAYLKYNLRTRTIDVIVGDNPGPYPPSSSCE
jgi:hypothetical protein